MAALLTDIHLLDAPARRVIAIFLNRPKNPARWFKSMCRAILVSPLQTGTNSQGLNIPVWPRIEAHGTPEQRAAAVLAGDVGERSPPRVASDKLYHRRLALQAANDNYRTPAEHLAIVASNPKPTNRPHKATSRQQPARLLAEDCPHMAMALNDWATLQALPVMTVANDNYVDAEDSDDGSAPAEWHFDNLMTTQSARLTVKLEAEGKPWRPGEERFDTPRRNNRSKAPPPVGSHRYNGLDMPTLPDAEGEANRKIDASNVRRRLGHVLPIVGLSIWRRHHGGNRRSRETADVATH
ncbi:hypothetical protein Nham_1713 [Nitrobacter hamburgensis X14]|uniref:Uncharacterized protein n=1 Tax=Nitrobacter hamburgensis (strain DSM 10229 / NCIMB 13809 / X14) TaxID=323097 RepID=Q1QML8_NITHX|nr:hypothetical protein Nham_1713 [Nitrobacter hamburgensis X14]